MASNSLSALLRPQRPVNGIDFMAFARGAAAGRDANWIDELRANKRIEMDASRGETLDKIQDREWDREAQRFSSTMMRNRQFAADAGISPTDYLITQRQQLLQDPNFQGMSPEVQQRVLNQIGSAARVHMEELTNTGRLKEALQVGQAYGFTPSATEVHVAGQTGDAGSIMGAINTRFGTQYVVDDEGLVDVNGINIPLNLVVQHVQQTGDASQLPALAAQWQAAEQAKEAQRLANEQANALITGAGALGINPATGLPVDPSAGLPAPTTPTPVASPVAPTPSGAALDALLGLDRMTDEQLQGLGEVIREQRRVGQGFIDRESRFGRLGGLAGISQGQQQLQNIQQTIQQAIDSRSRGALPPGGVGVQEVAVNVLRDPRLLSQAVESGVNLEELAEHIRHLATSQSSGGGESIGGLLSVPSQTYSLTPTERVNAGLLIRELDRIIREGK